MLLITVKDRYEMIVATMNRIADERGIKQRGFVGKIDNMARRFMHWRLDYPQKYKLYDDEGNEYPNEEYIQWILCEFFDRKYYENELFTSMPGCGATTMQFLRDVGEEIDRVHI